jgi:signal transduction histidine kinase
LADPGFLAALCHDLRGPLGAIGTWIHVLGSGRADEATQQQALLAMQRDVLAQGRLIDHLADLSSILGGTFSISTAEVDLVPLLESLGAELRAEAMATKVLADPRRLRQLLEIFVPAAEGARPVLTATAGEPGVLLIQGLAHRGGPGFVRLTLARALANAQGGQVTTSGATEGTVFVIRLPTLAG